MLAGRVARRNLCFTVSLRAAAYGVLQARWHHGGLPGHHASVYRSPSRLLSLMDPLLPLSALSKCVSAYAG